MTLADWGPIFAYAIIAIVIPAGMLVLGIAFGAKAIRPDIGGQKQIAFESGVSTGFLGRQRFPISFYLTAMLFIVFDIEMIFFYPLAVVLSDLGMFGFWELLVFVGILAAAFAYVWGRGALEWEER